MGFQARGTPGRVIQKYGPRQGYVVLDGRRSHHSTSNEGISAIDLETGALRESTSEDLRRALLFADALDKVDIVNVMVAANDVPAHVRTVRHFALAFTQTRDMRTVSVGMSDFIGQYGIRYGELMASSVMFSIPIVVVFFILQRHFVAGLTAGASESWP